MILRIISNTPDSDDYSEQRFITVTPSGQPGDTKRHSRLHIIEAVLVMTVIVTPLIVKATHSESVAVATPVVPVASETAPAYVKLLAARTNPNPAAVGGGELPVADGVLTTSGFADATPTVTGSRSQSEISVYTVREGDTLSQIAEMYSVTANTILWANDISSASSIQPGDTLVILPIAGVQHEIEEGDTLTSIVEDYDADLEEVLAYNGLTEDSELEVGSEIMIPGGIMHVAAAAQATSGGSTGSTGSFVHPAPGAVRTQGIHGYNAVDLAAGHGTAIRSAGAGEVIVAKASGWNGGYGSYIVVRHANGVQTLYAHLSGVYVGVGDWVGSGATIGAMGNTGRSTGTHVHFEVRGGHNPF